MSGCLEAAMDAIDEVVTPTRAHALTLAVLFLGWATLLMVGLAIDFVLWGIFGMIGWALTYGLLLLGWSRTFRGMHVIKDDLTTDVEDSDR